MLAAAQRLFLTDGYALTTIPKVAHAAGVSAEMVYKAFGNKPGLARALHEWALAGEGPVPTARQSDEMRAHEPDPRKMIHGWGVFATQVMPRVAPILLLIRAAAASAPDLARLWEELEDQRLERMTENARHLLDRGHLHEGCTLEEARDVLWAYTSPEVYERLVLRQCWPLERYGRFMSNGIIAALLPA